MKIGKLLKYGAIIFAVIWGLATVVPLFQGNPDKASTNFMVPVNFTINAVESLAVFADRVINS